MHDFVTKSESQVEILALKSVDFSKFQYTHTHTHIYIYTHTHTLMFLTSFRLLARLLGISIDLWSSENVKKHSRS